jgi:hypothetical protein
MVSTWLQSIIPIQNTLRSAVLTVFSYNPIIEIYKLK